MPLGGEAAPELDDLLVVQIDNRFLQFLKRRIGVVLQSLALGIIGRLDPGSGSIGLTLASNLHAFTTTWQQAVSGLMVISTGAGASLSMAGRAKVSLTAATDYSNVVKLTLTALR